MESQTRYSYYAFRANLIAHALIINAVIYQLSEAQSASQETLYYPMKTRHSFG